MPFSGPDQVGVSGALAQMFFDVAGQVAFGHFAATEEALATRLTLRGHGLVSFPGVRAPGPGGAGRDFV